MVTKLARFMLPDWGVLVTICLTLPLMQTLMPVGLPTVADMPIHLYRTVEFAQAWSSEVEWPRWSPNLAYGYGYPLFIFAPPLPYLLGYMFHGLGLSFESALKTLIILIILLYATGMYQLGRELWGSRQSGLISATAYVYAPFALRELFLYGGNIPQYLAIGLFPWILWTMYRLQQTGQGRWLMAASCAYTALILSHLFHALIFTPAALIFGLGLIGFNFKFQISNFKLLYSVLPLPLGGLLATFFWLPAFFERYATRAQADIYLQKSPFYIRYPHWIELMAWIYPLDSRAANPYVPLTLGTATLSLVIITLIISLYYLLKPKSHFSPLTSHLSFLISYFSLLTLFSIYLTLPLSRPVWETITILQVAEFPWRMLGLANVGLALLAGGAVYLSPTRWRWLFTIICLAWQIGTVMPYLYPPTPFTVYGEPTLANQIAYEHRSQSIGTTTLGEYLPQNVTQIPTDTPFINAFNGDSMPERLDRQSLPAQATATRLSQSAVTHRYQVTSPISFTLRLYQYDYLGWQAWLDGQPIPITPEAKTGLITVVMPAGSHDLTFHFGETPLRLTGFALSGLALMGLIALTIIMECKLKQPNFLRPINIHEAKAVVLKRQSTLKRTNWVLWADSLAYLSRLCFLSTTALASCHTLKKLILSFCLILTMLTIRPLLRPIFTLNSPPGQANLAQHATNIAFASGIRLIGYDLSATTVAAGGRLQVVLYWQADQPIKKNFQPFVHVDRLNDGTTAAAATNYTPGDVTTESVLPTFHWDTGRYVRDEHDLIIPADTLPIAYALRIGMLDPDNQTVLPLADGSGDTAQLTTVNIRPEFSLSQWLGHLPSNYVTLQNSFSHEADTLQLQGYQLEPITSAQLNFTLMWQSDRRPQADYTVFAQLLAADNHLVASFDSQPLDRAYPTSTWLPGQLIFDPRAIPLKDVPSGEYRLIVGLYQADTGARLLTDSGADFVVITTVTVP